MEFEECNEIKALNMEYYEALEDWGAFVRNIGVLLSMTREGIQGCEFVSELGGMAFAKILYKHGPDKTVNITHDSYMATLKDILEAIR